MKHCPYCNTDYARTKSKCPSCDAPDAEIKCDNCGRIHTNAYCPNCGFGANDELSVCPKCGRKSKERFCPSCGTPLDASVSVGMNTAIPTGTPIIINNNITNSIDGTHVFGGEPPKRKGVALLLCLFLGYFGGHCFYVGKTGTGILYIFTFGLFGFGWIVDIFRILSGSYRDRRGFRLR